MIDTSIYQNIKPVELASPLDSMQKGMSLSQLALQNQAMQRQFATQDALRQAYSKNMNPDGTLNRPGMLSDLASSPEALMSYQQHDAALGKSVAESQSAQAKAFQDTHAIITTGLQQVENAPDTMKPVVYQKIMADFQKQGIPTHNMPSTYDPEVVGRALDMGKKLEGYLKSQETEASIAEKRSNVAMAPAKLAADLYGSRSPNAELTGQYGKDVDSIRKSQLAMAQMLDNYKNPSPQGDESLILNAFKIKFPTAPDVNSLEQLAKAQAVPDKWRAAAAHALQGGLDQNTRDNLMRDGISTYRANYGSYQDIAKRYTARQQVQGVNDPTLTYEPALDKTYGESMELQKTLGPYKPPTEREGTVGSLARFVSKLRGGVEETANAASPEEKTSAPKAPAAKTAPSAQDQAALKWLESADKSDPDAFAVRAKLKKKGLL